MSSHIPNKPTLIAAAIYGASPQIENGDAKLAWNELSDDQRRPFIDAATFLSGQVFGIQIQRADRPKLAAGLEALKLEALDLGEEGEGNADALVSIFISVASALPSA